MTAPNLNADISTLSSLSVNQPDYFFVHGFITGIVCAPDLVPQSVWQPELFGEINFETEEQLGLMQSLMAFYNDIMKNAMERRLKMPDECQLLSSDIEGSVAEGQPLPSWCNGFLESLDLLDEEKLNDSQETILMDVEDLATAFTSYESLEFNTAMVGDSWKSFAMDMLKDLEAGLDDLLGVMRFGEELDFSDFDELMDEIEEGDFDDDDFGDDIDPFALMDGDDRPSQEDIEAQIEAIYETALFEDSPEAYTLLDRLIDEFETANGEGYFEGKDESFWAEPQHQNYVTLRSRRARVFFNGNKKAQSIAELQALISLAPGDWLGNRATLANIFIIEKDWDALSNLMSQYDANNVAMLATKALMLYANDPTNPEAKAAKKQLIKANKHVVKYLTGQKKVKRFISDNASAEIREVEIYILDYGQQAWRSVEGSLGWLRKK